MQRLMHAFSLGPDPNKHSGVARDKNMTPLSEGSGKSQPRMARIPGLFLGFYHWYLS